MSSITIMFFAYGLTAIVSMLVAVLIKSMTTMLQQAKAPANVPMSAKRSVPSAVPTAITAIGEMNIAVIAAAVYATIGSTVRIAKIEEKERGILWVASGRIVHHKQHVLTGRPPYKAT